MQIQLNDSEIPISESAFSSIQLDNPMKAFKKLYFFLILLGAIALAFGGPVGIIFGAVVGWTVAYLMMQLISGIKLIKLNFKDHPLSNPVTDDQLYERLVSASLHPDFKIEKGSWGVRFIFKNTTMHRIRIDRKSQTYSILSKLNKKNLIKKRHNPGVVEYTYAFTAVPLIKQAIEEATNTIYAVINLSTLSEVKK